MGAASVTGERTNGGERDRRQDGSILVLFSLLLTLFLLCGAIAVDVGYWWVNGKKAQIAADACALAAAHELPQTYDDTPNCAVAPGQADYVLTNLPAQIGPDPEPEHLWTRVRSPYKGSASMVEATVRVRVGTFFGRIVGLEMVEVERRAVAEKLEGESKMAIFTGSTDCSKGFLVNGKNVNVTGHIHSNGQYDVKSANIPDHFTATSGTIAKENCVANLDPEPDGARYGDGEDFLPQDGPELQWPDWYYPDDFGWYAPEGSGPGRCTYKGDHIQVDATHLKITGKTDQALAADPDNPGWTIVPTGTYCATGSFKISGNDHRGTITALAPLIQVDGNGQDYKPYAFDVLFFTVPNSNADATDDGPFTLGNFSPTNIPPYEPCLPSPAVDMNLDGVNYTWAGILFNPCGRVKINNHDSSVGTPDLVGTVYGFEVEINGDGFNMIGTEDFDDHVALALVE